MTPQNIPFNAREAQVNKERHSGWRALSDTTLQVLGVREAFLDEVVSKQKREPGVALAKPEDARDTDHSQGNSVCKGRKRRKCSTFKL